MCMCTCLCWVLVRACKGQETAREELWVCAFAAPSIPSDSLFIFERGVRDAGWIWCIGALLFSLSVDVGGGTPLSHALVSEISCHCCDCVTISLRFLLPFDMTCAVVFLPLHPFCKLAPPHRRTHFRYFGVIAKIANDFSLLRSV